MGWSIFVEEPGAHQRCLPYRVLAGIAVEDLHIWHLSKKLAEAETQFFGVRLNALPQCCGLDQFLDVQIVQIARSSDTIDHAQRAALTRDYLRSMPGHPSSDQVIAWAQSQLAFCVFSMSLLQDYEARAFTALTPPESSVPSDREQIGKDYVFFLERVARFLRDRPSPSIGTLVLDPSRHDEMVVSIEAITRYFDRTVKGRHRSQTLIPEPLMANSSLTSINHAAVILSRVVSWGFRLPEMVLPRRTDIDELVRSCNALRFPLDFPKKTDWSFIFVPNARSPLHSGQREI